MSEEMKCKDCAFGNLSEDPSYCGKRRNDGKPYSYDYWLPKTNFNPTGACKDFIQKRWWHKLWRAK